VNHGLIDGICGLVGEDAGGQARDDLLDLQYGRNDNKCLLKTMTIHMDLIILK